MRSVIIVPVMLFSLVSPASGQDPHLSDDAPRDKPGRVDEAGLARLDSLIAPYVARARETYPAAKKRFLAGLPASQSFFVTTRIHDRHGRLEQVFVAVDEVSDSAISGRIWSEIGVVEGYSMGQPYSFEESELLDWLITHPDGSEEGNFVGKFLDSYEP